MKYYAYIRKSSEDSTERQALSLPAQRNEINKSFSGSEILEFVEEAYSAFEPGRPKFDEMIKCIKGGKASGIICWHPDRLSRNSIDAGTIIHLLDKGIIKDLKFVAYQYNNDAEGKMMLGILLAQSKYYSDKLSKDVKRGIKTKLGLGQLPGCAPVGYKNTMLAVRGSNKIIVDEERFQTVRKFWDLMLTGQYSVAEIQRIADKDYKFRTIKRRRIGGVALSKNALFNMFRNPFYAGLIRHKGEYHPGEHRPIITIEEFDRVQLLLGRKGQPRPKTHKFPYTGMMTCGFCGGAVTAEIKAKKLKNGSTNFHTYYHCTHQKKDIVCKQKSITDRNVEEYFGEALENFQIPQEFIDWGMKYLNELNDKAVENRSIMVANTQNDYNKIQGYLDRLTKAYYRELIDEEEFKKQKEELLVQKANLSSSLLKLDSKSNSFQESTEEFFEFLKNAKYWFLNGDEEVKKLTVLQFASNLVVRDKKITIVADNLFSIIEKGLTKIKTEATTFEPENFGSCSYKTPELSTIYNLWQGLEESNP